MVPLGVIAILGGKVFQILSKVAILISDILPFETIAGIAVVNLVAMVLIVILCFFAGRLARSHIGEKITASVESKMYALVPRYAFIKSMTAALSEDCQDENLLKPVWVKFDD